MLKKALMALTVLVCAFSSERVDADEGCSKLVDPVEQFTCWINGTGGVVQPMGPGSGGTGGDDGEPEVKTE